MSVTRRVIVIGAGITGLACALRLHRSGIRVLVLEASDVPGGMIATSQKNGFLFEAGPQCPRFARPLWDIVRDVELEDEFVPSPPGARRFILKAGELHEAPFSVRRFVSTRLVGATSKYRLLTEALRRAHPPAAEESLAEFVRRKFDDDVLAYLVDPFISAIYAGDTEQMGVESAFPFLAKWEREGGSVLRGAIRSRKPSVSGSPQATSSPAGRKTLDLTESLPRMGSFRTGLAALPKAIATKLGDSMSFRVKAESIEPVAVNGGSRPGWRLRLVGGEELTASVVVVTAPAYEAARLLQNAAPKLGTMLAEISYAPMAVVSSGYDRAQVRNPLRGFGVLVPRREKLNTFFNVWNSSLLAGRAPEGKVLLTSFTGGSTNPAILERDDAAIAEIIEGEMGAVLRIDGPPAERCVWKYPRALPQFNLGHARRITSIREALAELPGMYLAGNYLQGRSLGDCAELGSRTADLVKRHF
ncbi:MAG: protoporphyrinogen oxidase [Candidatus Acidiferrales bacterium]